MQKHLSPKRRHTSYSQNTQPHAHSLLTHTNNINRCCYAVRRTHKYGGRTHITTTPLRHCDFNLKSCLFCPIFTHIIHVFLNHFSLWFVSISMCVCVIVLTRETWTMMMLLRRMNSARWCVEEFSLSLTQTTEKTSPHKIWRNLLVLDPPRISMNRKSCCLIEHLLFTLLSLLLLLLYTIYRAARLILQARRQNAFTHTHMQ